MAKREKKPKKPFLSGYKTYNPKEEGYGNPEAWKKAFQYRLGLDKSNEILGGDDPLSVLGITEKNPSWDAIKSAYRKMALQHHPDRNIGDESASDRFKKIQAAYEVLEAKYKR